jgi:hypothetical protein
MNQFDTTGSGHIPVGWPHIHLATDSSCPHTGINVRPKCAGLTDAEVAALREHFALLAAANAADQHQVQP